MRLIADLNIAPRTVEFLCSRGHDVIRVSDVLAATASDQAIVDFAGSDRRTVLTQDLDLSTIVALSGRRVPSVITLRLASSKIEAVNAVLDLELPRLESAVGQGVVVTIDDGRVRTRTLPVA